MSLPPQKGHLMMADNIQYTTVCPLCRAQLPLSQKQVETGRAPICDGCGGTMIVHGANTRGRKRPRKHANPDGEPRVRGTVPKLTHRLVSVFCHRATAHPGFRLRG